MIAAAAKTGVRTWARPSLRAFSAAPSPWGSNDWQVDKKAFINWCTEAVSPGQSTAKREFYGFCALSFGDVDTNKDGFINLEEFDRLLEAVAAIPRRYGLAPLSTGDAMLRMARHKVIFDAVDAKHGAARGVLGLDQFVEWAFEHVAGKVTQIPAKSVNLEHVEDYAEADYLDFVERAVTKPGSYEHSSFYNFILSCFVEADTECKGRVNYEQFEAVLTKAASVPRFFGLAPTDVHEDMRKMMFETMQLYRDGQPTGFVTPRRFWEWTVEHVGKKIALQKAGKGWRESKK